MIHLKATNYRIGLISLIVISLTLVFQAAAQSPNSIGGRTFELTITGGSTPFASSGSYRFLPSAVNGNYAIVPISGDVDAGYGTHTYTKTGANTATLALVDEELGGLNANVTFNTANSGTYVLTSTAIQGPSQTGTFILYAGQSPATIAGTTITVTITSGVSPFGAFGAYRFLPTAGGAYIIDGISGDVVDSSGTYSYNQDSTWTGYITFNDSVVGTGLSSQLSFDSPTTGTVFLQLSGSSGYQTGLFSMTPPATAPTISTHPAGQEVVLGAPVSFTVTASGTAPLSYQWRKDTVNISGANSATYSIASAQESDQGNYDVVVSNSGGSVTSSAATLAVVVPPGIQNPPASQSVLAGDNVLFTVNATGSAPFSYQWFKDDVAIGGATLSSYSLSNVQVGDAGNYSVRVGNAAGSVTSQHALLEVVRIATTPPVLQLPAWNPSSGFTAILQGEAQTSYRIQWSTNLVEWHELADHVTVSSSMEFSDPDASTEDWRFYRVVSP